jgi:hypothetical protein
MSYLRLLSNYNVTFKDEQSYLNCRLGYLALCEATVPGFEITFIQFIQDEVYDKELCEVESIYPVLQTGENLVITDGGSGGISSITDAVTISGNLTVTGNITAGEIITGGAPIANTSSDNFSDGSSNIVFGYEALSQNIVIGEEAGTGSTNGSVEQGLDTFWDEGEELKLKEEEPDDPILTRWEILDL